MTKDDLIPCKIIFKDPFTQKEKCCIGWISRSEIKYFNTNESKFITLQGEMNISIDKDTIAELTIYEETNTLPVKNGKVMYNHLIIRRHRASICF